MSFRKTFPTSNKMLKILQIGRICLGSATFLGESISEICYIEIKTSQLPFFFFPKLFKSGSKKGVTQIIHVEVLFTYTATW